MRIELTQEGGAYHLLVSDDRLPEDRGIEVNPLDDLSDLTRKLRWLAGELDALRRAR